MTVGMIGSAVAMWHKRYTWSMQQILEQNLNATKVSLTVVLIVMDCPKYPVYHIFVKDCI